MSDQTQAPERSNPHPVIYMTSEIRGYAQGRFFFKNREDEFKIREYDKYIHADTVQKMIALAVLKDRRKFSMAPESFDNQIDQLQKEIDNG
jgi:hypothetical protein